MNSFANSNTVAQVMEMPIRAELTQLYAPDTTDGVYEEFRDDLDEISQSPLLKIRDTAANDHLNLRKPDRQLVIIPTETITYSTEREKYVNTAKLSPPIMFYAEKPSELGIALEDILKKNSRRLSDRDDLVFEGGSRSISLRIEKTIARHQAPLLKKNLQKTLLPGIRRFIQKTHRGNMEADPNPMWRISADGIKFEDIILVSLNHVSQGSWQPQLRVRRQAQDRA
ncbi:hypothetical protein EDD22DRAFT_916690 [Suillus occidentalis]|nr:hypothetical protein EDD22DRAFT_916690 [Suillus occidentalis]